MRFSPARERERRKEKLFSNSNEFFFGVRNVRGRMNEWMTSDHKKMFCRIFTIELSHTNDDDDYETKLKRQKICKFFLKTF